MDRNQSTIGSSNGYHNGTSNGHHIQSNGYHNGSSNGHQQTNGNGYHHVTNGHSTSNDNELHHDDDSDISVPTGACTERFLRQKVALVTGSTSGIGLGIAIALAKRGCNIVLNGFGDDELITALKKQLTSFGVRVDYVAADLTKLEEIEALCQNILNIYPQGIDILVNNAGFQTVSPVDEFPVAKWDAMIALMLTAPFHLIRIFLPHMKRKHWGRIINISSVHGLKASPNKTAYIAAKHGLVGLTKTVGLETARDGVTCMAICPGYVDTVLFQNQIKVLAEKEGTSYEAAKVKFLSVNHASGEAVGIEQVAETATFLCSSAASQMTGSCMVLDGGWAAK